MSRHDQPISIVLTRGDTDESRHRVRAVIASADGPVESWGDIEAPVFPRSSLKPFQAMAMIASGAAEAYHLAPEQLALSMASHSGEPKHADLVMAWLGWLELDESALHCGSHPPMSVEATYELVRQGQTPSARHHNCSGKHSGMLTLARHLDAPPNYEDYDHPVQAAIRATASRFLGLDFDTAPWGRDGCAVPNYAVPLRALAQGYARLLTPPDDLAEGCQRLLAAWGAHPDLVAGSNRFDTAVMRISKGRVLSKAGAEGVQAALVPERGLGLAVKAEDGAKRAAEQAMAALLGRLGLLDPDSEALAAAWPEAGSTIRNARGDTVGHVLTEL